MASTKGGHQPRMFQAIKIGSKKNIPSNDPKLIAIAAHTANAPTSRLRIPQGQHTGTLKSTNRCALTTTRSTPLEHST